MLLLLKTCFVMLLCITKSVLSIDNATDNVTSNLKEIEFKEGASIEAQYVLPSINMSAFNAEIKNQSVTASLARVLDFYNTEILAASWSQFRDKLTVACQVDMELYLKGLSHAENWALKMDDASGRYSTGWFWGNHYWTGSRSLCENIEPKTKRIIVVTQNSSRVARKADIPLKPSSPSQSAGYKKGPIVYSSVPPFSVSFFMLRLHLNSSFTTEEKILHVGLCLPNKCSDDDVREIMEETSNTQTKISVKVDAVRSDHSRFIIWNDRTFLVLCCATCIIALLLIIGTSFDFYLEHMRTQRKLSRTNNHFSTLMTESEVKTKNGRCSLYTVNTISTNDNNNHGNFQQTLDMNANNPSSHARESVTTLILRELLLSFSIRANLKSICDQTVGCDTLPVIHGLKAISMAWVILGHTCIVAFKYSDNMEYRKVVQKEFMFQTISNGAFSVDTFFFTSGLLVSFLYFRTNANGKLDPLTKGRHSFVARLLHFWGLISYRFARLTAPYLFTLGVVEVTMKWFYYNSVFEPPTMDHITCPNYWWRNVLYINTLFPVEEMCMIWSWYLSDDTQFYTVGAIILILATGHFKSAAAILLVFMMSSWFTTGYIAYSNSHMPGSDDPLALFDKIYDKPYMRLGPYLIGMCIGWLLFKKDCIIHMSKLTLIIGWTASFACLLALVFGLYEADLSPLTGAAYSSLSHSAWAFGVAWIVLACSTGYGGIVNKILSATILYPFSRVTYCAYLLHPIVIRVMVMSMDSPLHLGSVVTIIIFMGQVVASYALSFFVSLAFEAPVVSMLRIISKVVANRKNRPVNAT